MNSIEHSDISPRFWTWLAIAWVLVIAKCLMVPWAIGHWHIPFGPAWIVVPTLIFAAVATLLLLTRFRFGEPKG